MPSHGAILPRRRQRAGAPESRSRPCTSSNALAALVIPELALFLGRLRELASGRGRSGPPSHRLDAGDSQRGRTGDQQEHLAP